MEMIIQSSNLNTAMILAAGFGTRLKPLTDHTPKALLKINNKTLLEIVIEKLIKGGITRIVVNAHHFSNQVAEFLSKKKFGVNIEVCIEEKILGTGGAIKNAEKYLNNSGYFLVYNVDVISEINLAEMEKFHIENNPLATLAIQKRDTSRPLIFDSENKLIGRKNNSESLQYRTPGISTYLAGFCGVHIISSDIFKLIEEEGFFDIFKLYFRLVSGGRIIMGYDIKDSYWIDIGTKNNFENYSRENTL